MRAIWNTLAFFFFLQGIIITAVSGSCTVPKMKLHPTDTSGNIVYGMFASNDCTWVLPDKPSAMYALMLDLTDVYILTGYLYMAETGAIRGSMKSCHIYTSRNLICKFEAVKENILLEIGRCEMHSVESLPRNITYRTDSSDYYNRFTLSYNLINCGAGTAANKATTEKTALTTSRKLPEDDPRPSSPDPGTSGANSAVNTPYVTAIAVLVILLLVAVAIILVMSHRMRKLKSDQVEAIVRASRSEQGLRISAQNAQEGRDLDDSYATIGGSGSGNISASRLHGQDTSEQHQPVAESNVATSSCVYAVVQKKR